MRELPLRVRRARLLAASLILLAVLGRLTQLATPAPPGADAALLEIRVDPMRAPVEVLELLPGIGPARARAIAQARVQGVRLTRPEDLLRIPGIGPATLEGLRPCLEFAAASGPDAGR